MNIEVANSPEDDYDLIEILECVSKTLKDSGIQGEIPTSLQKVIEYAGLTLAGEIKNPRNIKGVFPDFLSSSFTNAYRKVRAALIYSTKEVWLKEGQPPEQNLFHGLHECGHALIPSQEILRSYLVLDDNRTLNPATGLFFEKQANIFAAHMIFQKDVYKNLTKDNQTSLSVPIKLCNVFSCSRHVSIRHYVETCSDPCIVLVLSTEPSLLNGKVGRKVLSAFASPHYLKSEQLPKIDDWYSNNHQFCSIRDNTVEYLRPHYTTLRTLDGNETTGFHYEIFCNSYNHFVMLKPTLNRFSLLHTLPIAP